MHLNKIITGIFILLSISLIAEDHPSVRKTEKNTSPKDSIQLSIDYLKKYIQATDGWQSDNPEIVKAIIGLIHFTEDGPIDSIQIRLEKFRKMDNFRYINRSSAIVSDSLQIAGYQSYLSILEKMKQLDRAIWNGVDMNAIHLPEALIGGPDHKFQPIEVGDEHAILDRTGILLPDSLKNTSAVSDSNRQKPNDFNRIKNREKMRTQILEEARVRYNIKIQHLDLDSAINVYRKHAVRLYSDSLQNQLYISLKRQNEQILNRYNDSIVGLVNDSINRFVKTLQQFAQSDSVEISIRSLSGKPCQLWLRNNKRAITRFYIKNEQNDSLAIRMMTLDKHGIGVAIDDDVTFNRLAQKQRRDIVFEKITPEKKLSQMKKRFEVIAPWDMGGFGTFGFSQTYLNNWKAGGNSALAFLTVLKSYANYSNAIIRWENTGEFRNGWIRQGGGINQLQKNDDKLELISRLGVSAFKKWFYSTEVDFQTQFFNGYNYPDKTKLISGYLSPTKTMFKLGLDYKPNKRFSLFLSPFTLKTVYVRDTARIDQTTYGISRHSKSFWEPGLNAEIKYRIEITPQMSYETKYKMFMNYKDPFKKMDLDWENTFVAQLNERINMTFMLNLLYDDNITFSTGRMDSNGIEIFKPKLQTKELITVGFSYKINHHVYIRRNIEK